MAATINKDMNKKKNDIRVHVNPEYFGNRLYVFTKDSKHCIAVEYNPAYDFGKGSPSGARIESVEIHTNNGFVFNKEWKEISLSEVPERIIELLTYLKVDCPTDEEVFEYARHISDEYEPSQPERDSMFTLEKGTMFKIINYAKGKDHE